MPNIQLADGHLAATQKTLVKGGTYFCFALVAKADSVGHCCPNYKAPCVARGRDRYWLSTSLINDSLSIPERSMEAITLAITP